MLNFCSHPCTYVGNLLTWGIYGEKKSCGRQPLSGQRLPLSTQVLLFAQVVHGVQVCTLLAHQRKPGGNRHNITQCTSKQVWLLLFLPPAGLSTAATSNLALRVLLQVVSGAWSPMHTITIWWLEADYCQSFGPMLHLWSEVLKEIWILTIDFWHKWADFRLAQLRYRVQMTRPLKGAEAMANAVSPVAVACFTIHASCHQEE